MLAHLRRIYELFSHAAKSSIALELRERYHHVITDLIPEVMPRQEMTMADFFITAVQYNEDKNHIESVEVREDLGWGSVGEVRLVPRAFIVDLIRLDKASFRTATHEYNGKWTSGDNVVTYGQDFLTTEGNSTRRDNLDELPEF